mmetsp:Transcript_92935/g.267362  ORF Transcript_92935/g.267362 Transcript_92935/m.267362 type:complete len:461 (+) Transcript_92935:43-1425(+)
MTVDTKATGDSIKNGPTGTVWSSSVNLAKTIMGTGLLSLPYAFAGCGLVWGITFTVACSILGLLGMFFIGDLMHLGGERPTYCSVATRAAGRVGGVLADLGVLVICMGAATMCLIIASTSLPSLVGHGRSPIERQLYVAGSVALVTPLCLLRRVNSLRFTSSIGIAALTFIAVMILVFAMPGAADAGFDACSGRPDCRGEVSLGAEPLSVIKQVVIFANAYVCHQSVVPIVAEMERPTRMRRLAAFTGATGFACLTFLVVATAGYFTFGANATSDILRSYPADSIFASFARAGILIDVLSTYPLQVFYSRVPIISLLETCGRVRGESPEEDGGEQHFLTGRLDIACSFGILALTTSVALLVEDLGIIVSLIGGTGATMISYIVPGLARASWRGGEEEQAASDENEPIVVVAANMHGDVSNATDTLLPSRWATSASRAAAVVVFVMGCMLMPLSVVLTVWV